MIEEIESFIAGMEYEQFCADERAAKAVIADFAIIGEAARYVPAEIQDARPDIPWYEMRAMRNVMVHVYH